MSESAETKRRRRASARVASSRTAQSRKCPRCQRKAALSAPTIWPGEGRVRGCLYCGHEVGLRNGEPFGRDVAPEPGAGHRSTEG
jgi:hypothetical protein